MSDASFFKKHQTAIVATVGVAASAAAAYYVYTQTSSAVSAAAADLKKSTVSSKKKSKKSKKKTRAYPLDAAGNPDVSEEFINGLSEEERQTIALAVKEDGNEIFKKKQYVDAINYYTAAIALKKDPAFYSNRSACYIALKNFEKVIEDTTSALELNPEYSKCILRRATAYEQLGQYANAMHDLTAATIYGGFNTKPTEEALERILKTYSYEIVARKLKDRVPQLPSASSIASFFSGYSEEKLVEGLPQSSAELETNTGDFFLVSAVEKINERSYTGYEKADSFIQQAIAAYEKEEQTDSLKHKLAVALEYAGIFNFLKSDPLKALEEVDRAIELHPRSRSYVFKAMISADKQEVAEAEKCLASAIALDPNSSEIYYQRGQMYYLFGQLDKAKADFAKAKELNSKNLYSFIQLACIIYREGDFGGADKAFQEAKKLFPTSPEIPNYYGEILADKGDFQRAATQFEISYKLEEALPKICVGIMPLVNKAALLSRDPTPESLQTAIEILEKACDIDAKSELGKITLAQLKLQTGQTEDAIKLFEESADLARSLEEKVQATSFAEASKIQLRIHADPILSLKIKEAVDNLGASQAVAAQAQAAQAAAAAQAQAAQAALSGN